jgi:hypothetical protein
LTFDSYKNNYYAIVGVIILTVVAKAIGTAQTEEFCAVIRGKSSGQAKLNLHANIQF